MHTTGSRARKIPALAVVLSLAISLHGCSALSALRETRQETPVSESSAAEESKPPQSRWTGNLPLTEDSGFSEYTRITITSLPEGWGKPETHASGRQSAIHEALAESTRFCSITSDIVRSGHQVSLTTDDILTDDYIQDRLSGDETNHTALLHDDSVWLNGENGLSVEVRLLQYATEYLDVPGEGFATHLLRGYAPRGDRSRWYMLATLECRSPFGIEPLTQEEFDELFEELLPSLVIELPS